MDPLRFILIGLARSVEKLDLYQISTIEGVIIVVNMPQLPQDS